MVTAAKTAISLPILYQFLHIQERRTAEYLIKLVYPAPKSKVCPTCTPEISLLACALLWCPPSRCQSGSRPTMRSRAYDQGASSSFFKEDFVHPVFLTTQSIADSYHRVSLCDFPSDPINCWQTYRPFHSKAPCIWAASLCRAQPITAL